MPRPVFLIGVPKSGTTLVQRLLASHPEIATADEPWVLLPMIYALKPSGVVAEYGARSARLSFQALINSLPHGVADYHESVRAMAETLYRRLSHTETVFFVDKTPRYHLILDSLVDIFPDAVFIFVLRNPLSVIGSIIEHNGGRISGLVYGAIDVRQGYPNISAAIERSAARTLVISYESLVTKPEADLGDLFGKLGLRKVAISTDKLAPNTFARGDRNGDSYVSVSNESCERWRETLATPMRKAFAIRLIRQLSSKDLEIQGYDKSTLLRDISSLETKISMAAGVELGQVSLAKARTYAQKLLLRNASTDNYFY